ncbi:MAG TPA: zinc-ribbon domain-containing protein [Acidimicrobiia bacterium]|nr:zinc-ribbon domain-containing protein [Acidimicrobiia bacterium]
MTVPAGPVPGAEGVGATCTLCGTPVPDGAERCTSCGLVRTTSPVFSRPELWAIGAVFAAVYAATVVLVAAAR